MKNVLKFDFYKFARTKSTHVMLFCIAAFALLMTAIAAYLLHLTQMDVLNASLTVTTAVTTTTSVADWCVDIMSGDWMLLFIMIYAILFSCNDYATGFLKNGYNALEKKWHYVLSKMAIVAVFSVLASLLTCIVTIVSNLAFVHSPSFGDAGAFIVFALNKTFLLIAYGCVGVLLSFLLRKASACLALSMVYSFGFVNLVYLGINLLVRLAGLSKTFDIQNYTIIGNMLLLGMNIDLKQQLTLLAVGTIAILLSFLASSFLFAKRDV